jgi:plastocyanin
MTNYRSVTRLVILALPIVLLAQLQSAYAQKNSYACKEPDPTALCTAANTCSENCSVDVKRTSQAASATPSFPGAKGNSTFCVKAGTQVTWKSDTKHQGFVVDFGPNSPFDTPDIIGGSDRSVTTTAKTPGCYRYSAGACLSGAIYGMCGNSNAEVVVLK